MTGQEQTSGEDAHGMTLCGQPDPTNDGQPCWQEATYSVRLSGFHGLPERGEQQVDACADHLAWWREAFPGSVLAARSLSAPGR